MWGTEDVHNKSSTVLQSKLKSFRGPLLSKIFVSFPGSWETGTGFSQPRVHTVMGKDECPQGTSPTHNCMNEWLGEPVLVSQLPGRGILRIYINNLAIKGVFVEKIVCILNISLKNKKVPVVCH